MAVVNFTIKLNQCPIKTLVRLTRIIIRNPQNMLFSIRSVIIQIEINFANLLLY